MAIWISHRGESTDAPENTASAFRLAAERNTDGIETDIHLTADNIVICCHDSDTKRTCGDSFIIEKTNFADLRKLDASNGKKEFSGEPLPTFAEALAILPPGKKFYVEIKENDPRVIEPMISEINKAGVSFDQIVMISFHADVVREYKAQYPAYQALWLTGFTPDAEGRVKTAADIIAVLQETKADGVDINGKRDYIDERFVKTFHDAGYVFAVWTIDNADDAAYFVKAGVDVITSNCAAAMCKAVAG